MSAERAAGSGETCIDCLVVTDLWVRGWDGKVRCMDHAPNGALGALARHCPTCTCINRPRPAGAPS